MPMLHRIEISQESGDEKNESQDDRGGSRLPNDQASAAWVVPGRPIGGRGKEVNQSW